MQLESYDYVFKIVLVGDSGVGKSNLLSRFLRNEFNIESKATIGVEFSSEVVSIDRTRIKALVWDTAGQERYRALTSAYYRGAVGAIIVYDVTSKASYDSVSKWLDEVKENLGTDSAVMLLGNKTDLVHLRQVASEDAQALAHSRGLLSAETSALDNANVRDSFTLLIREIYDRMNKNPSATHSSQTGASPRGDTIHLNAMPSPSVPARKPRALGACCST